jgi:hypothetical protein
MESRLEKLKEAATEFVVGKAVEVSEDWDSVKFRFGARAVTISLGVGKEEGFRVLVDSDYEGTLQLEAVLVEEPDHKSLRLCKPEYRLEDGKRYPMPPGPAYSLLALGVVVAHVTGHYLYEVLCNIGDSVRAATRLLVEINENAEAKKTRPWWEDWEDKPELLEKIVESYVYLIL